LRTIFGQQTLKKGYFISQGKIMSIPISVNLSTNKSLSPTLIQQTTFPPAKNATNQTADPGRQITYIDKPISAPRRVKRSVFDRLSPASRLIVAGPLEFIPGLRKINPVGLLLRMIFSDPPAAKPKKKKSPTQTQCPNNALHRCAHRGENRVQIFVRGEAGPYFISSATSRDNLYTAYRRNPNDPQGNLQPAFLVYKNPQGQWQKMGLRGGSDRNNYSEHRQMDVRIQAIYNRLNSLFAATQRSINQLNHPGEQSASYENLTNSIRELESRRGELNNIRSELNRLPESQYRNDRRREIVLTLWQINERISLIRNHLQ